MSSIARAAFIITRQALRSEGFRKVLGESRKTLDDIGRVVIASEAFKALFRDDDDDNNKEKESPPLPPDPLPPGARDLPGHDPDKPIA